MSQTLKDYFPQLNINWLEPLDNTVLIQAQYRELSKTFHIDQGTKRAEQLASCIAKVIKKGHAAYKSKDGNGVQWQDYKVEVDEYVLIPRGLGVNYIWLKHPNDPKSEVLVMSVADSSIKQKVTDPMEAIGSLATLDMGA